MRKLISELAEGPYRVVVSKGPQAKEIELADSMEGAELLPQASILPMARSLAAVSTKLRMARGTERAANLMEQIASES
jgi:hypothetical protein